MMGVVRELSQELDQRIFVRLQRMRNQLAIALNSLQEVALQFNELADDLRGVIQDINSLKEEVRRLKSEKEGKREKRG